jgi:hypothetical protein
MNHRIEERIIGWRGIIGLRGRSSDWSIIIGLRNRIIGVRGRIIGLRRLKGDHWSED